MSDDALAKQSRRGVRQIDVTRLVRAAQSAGLTVHKIEVEGSKITLVTEPQPCTQTPLQEWRAKKKLVF